ncbi:trypco2 family protein [Streptomyces thermoalcalitolerans]|uniref:Trypsin-co-occurring domain-containing protein n=1 Tax=Streptomyces thermoalcalitolerans TaxID=65605 RepID=A0ABN1NRD7_9ACTN
MGISLAEALAELRQELYSAQNEGAGEQFRFEVEQAELSLEVEFRRDAGGKVKVEVGALGAKAGGEAGGGTGSTRRQLLTLKLQVRDEALGGERVRIRRPAGGLNTADGDVPERSPDIGSPDGHSAKDAEPRPWEA